MTMIIVTIKLPKEIDSHYRRDAQKRGISKGAVIREALIKQVREEKEKDKQAIAA